MNSFAGFHERGVQFRDFGLSCFETYRRTMRNACLFLVLVVHLSTQAQSNATAEGAAFPSSKYSRKTPVDKVKKNILNTVLFEGSAYDMAYLQMSAQAVLPSKRNTCLQVPHDEEHLIIIKSGAVNISFADSSWTLGSGSIPLLMPDEKYTILTPLEEPGYYYLMKYRSRSPADYARGKSSGGSCVKDWNKIPFRPHDRGGIRRYFDKPTAMCKRFEMHVTTLNVGLKSHEPHTHKAEEIVLMVEDSNGSRAKTEMQIGENFFQGSAGDLYYIGSDISHAIRNDGGSPCTYFAYQFN